MSRPYSEEWSRSGNGKGSTADSSLRVRRCPTCANNCPLTEPKCETGRKLAEEGGIWESTVEQKKGPFAGWIEKIRLKREYR